MRPTRSPSLDPVRVAAFDLGSNSFHLIVAEVVGAGNFEPITTEKEMLRLGDLVARQGRIPEDAAEAAVAAVRRFRQLADAAGATEIAACGTSALRRAANGAEVVDRIEAEAGVPVEMISGTREAELIFRAIRAGVLLEPAPALCFDLGGGSVEIMVGDAAGLQYAASDNLGSPRSPRSSSTTIRSPRANGVGSERTSKTCSRRSLMRSRPTSRSLPSAAVARSRTSGAWLPCAAMATCPVR
jgi:exopolyphosphatase/pppGpp-phosphohydrolase